jgi:hypothetical protein
VEKYNRAGESTDDNMVHVHFMLSTEGYILLEYVILFAFLTATVVA